MAKSISNGDLLIHLHKYIMEIKKHTEIKRYSQFEFFEDIYKQRPISKTTLRDFLVSTGKKDDTFRALAEAISDLLSDVHSKHSSHVKLDPLVTPQLGWLIDRILRDDIPHLRPEDFIMNHVGRFLVAEYKIKLTVRPSLGQTAEIERAGQPVEIFPYDDVAIIEYDLRFSKHNRRTDPGFKLAYGTHNGRINLLDPHERRLADDKSYRLHKRNAVYELDPQVTGVHRMELEVLGGFGLGNEGAHFSMAQPAIYQRVSFTLDLGGYHAKPLFKPPALMMVPVLKDRKFDCCEIARRGQGLPIEPDKSPGKAPDLKWTWTFKSLRDVMIGVHWQVQQPQTDD